MDSANLVYSSRAEKGLIPTTYSKRANAPERGTVFTAQAIKKEGKTDLIVDKFDNYCGYVKKNFDNPRLGVEPGKFYRFEVVAGPYTRDYHNFFYAIPLREIGGLENKQMNLIDPQTSLLIQRLGEFLLGLGWNREIKKQYILSNTQWNWAWFYKNFM